MIKLFRNFRKKMLLEAKTKKYLTYAIGEIILVVIGILIALQINNWNETRKEKEIIYQLLLEIDEDLKADIEGFNIGIKRYNLAIKHKQWGLKRTEYSIEQSDSIFLYLRPYSFDYDIVNKGFEKLKNSGINNYYEYKNIINSLNQYYTVNFNQYNRYINWDINNNYIGGNWFTDIDSKFELSFGGFPTIISQSENNKLRIVEIKKPYVRNQMMMRLNRRKTIVDVLEKIKKEAILLRSFIAENIK